MIFTPHDYQQEGIDFVTGKANAGLFLDPGLGKTAIMLSAINKLYFEEFPKVLVIAPLRVAQNVWSAEVAKWQTFDWMSCTVLHGKHKEKRAVDPNHDIYLINVENIFWLVDMMLEKSGPKFDWLIIDESSMFKDPSTSRFKHLKKVAQLFKRRYILTGTPSPNSLMGLWSQIYVLDRGSALGANITQYRRKYFNTINRGNYNDYELIPGADKDIPKTTAPLVIRMDAKDCLSLPPVVYNTISVTLPPKVRKQYDSFEKDLFAELDGEEKFIQTSVAAYLVCRQVANGFVYVPKQLGEFDEKTAEERTEVLHNGKIEALKELIGELQGKPVLVAYHFKQDLIAIKQALGAKVPHIGAGVSSRETAKHIKDWNAGKLPVLLGHPQSMSHGLNLQAGGNDVVWYSLTDSLENYLQLNRRILRQGVKGQVRVHHIVTEKTIDVVVMQRLKAKDTTQQAFLDAIKEYRRTKK
jgi:SNF2 family DNA or RNA helicase